MCKRLAHCRTLVILVTSHFVLKIPLSPSPSYEGVSVTDFSTSWQNGLAFCAIIHRHRPDLLDYKVCNPDTPIDNLKMAYTVAEQELKIIDPNGEKISVFSHSIKVIHKPYACN